MHQADFAEIRDAAEDLGSHLIATTDPVLSAYCCVGADGYVKFATAIKAGVTTSAIEALSQVRTVAVLVLTARDEGGIDRPKVTRAARRLAILATDAINLLHAEAALTSSAPPEQVGFCGGVNGLEQLSGRWNDVGSRPHE